MIKKQYVCLLFFAMIVALGFTNVSADNKWQSNYRDVQQIQGTEYFLIHLYDVQIGQEKFYAAGVADKDGNIVLPVEYAFIDAENFSDGRRLIATFGKYGYVDENFKIVIEPVYDQALPFENGTARVQKNNPDGTSRVFYIDKDGNEVADPTPEAERDYWYYMGLAMTEQNVIIGNRVGESYYAVCFNLTAHENVKTGIINVKTGEYLSPMKWDNVAVNKSGEIWGQMKNTEGSYDTYVIGDDGAEEFKFKSECIAGVWENGLINFVVFEPVEQKDYDFSEDERSGATIPKSGLMDVSGRVIIEPVWETPVPGTWSDEYQVCQDGYLIGMKGSENYTYIKGIGTMGDGKYGCVTTAGVVVIEPIYDAIEYAGNDTFTVTLNGKTETINLSGAPLPSKTTEANPTGSPIYVNGKKIDFEAYLIDGYNYFKLRDIAYALNGTEKQFEAGYDEELKVISITTGKAYSAIGDELSQGDGKVKEARLNSSDIYLDGGWVKFTAYNIEGYNFFKLRDLGGMLNFAVGYDEVNKSVSIDTRREYGDFVTTLEPSTTGTISIAGQTISKDATTLLLNGKDISDLSPIAELTNLRELRLAGNQITDITPLAGLSKLTYLVLNDNQITDISPLAGLTQLTELYLQRNQITDVNALAGLTKLTTVDLIDNQITDVTPLAGLNQLQTLWLVNNQITDLSPLADLKQLTGVELGGNQITDWTPVEHVKNVGGKPRF